MQVDQILPLPLRRDTDGTKTVTLVQAPLLAGISSMLHHNVQLPHVVKLSDTVDLFRLGLGFTIIFRRFGVLLFEMCELPSCTISREMSC